MGLYRRKDSPVWWFSLRVGRIRVRESTGSTNRRQAERVFSRRLKEIEEEGEKCGSQVITFGKLCERFLSEYVPRLKDRARPRGAIARFRLFFGDETLLEDVGDRVGSYEAGRRGARPATIVRELGILRRMFTVARRRWRWVKDNPVDLVELPKVDNSRVRYLKPGELESLELALPHWLRPIVTMARHTGLRRGSLLSLSWDEVDFSRGVLYVVQGKTGVPVSIPLTETALKVLRKQGRLRHLASPFVFCDDRGGALNPSFVTTVFRRATSKAGLKDLRFHDLRHDFASCLVQSGVDLNTVRELLGHKDLRMTLRYAHLSSENLREAVTVLDDTERSRSGHVVTGGGSG